MEKLSLYDAEGYPIDKISYIVQEKGEESFLRIKFLNALLETHLLTEISSSVLTEHFFNLYERHDAELKDLFLEKHTSFQHLTKLDVVLILLETENAYDCLEEEGEVFGYRPVMHSLPFEALIIIIQNVGDYDVIENMLTLNKETYYYFYTNPTILAIAFANNGICMRKKITSFPETLHEYLCWIKKHFYTRYCTRYFNREVCYDMFLIKGDIDWFLAETNSPQNTFFHLHINRIMEYCTWEEMLYISNKSYREIRPLLIYFLLKRGGVLTKEKALPIQKTIKKLVDNSPLQVLEIIMTVCFLVPNSMGFAKYVYRKLERDASFEREIFSSNLAVYISSFLTNNNIEENISYKIKIAQNKYLRLSNASSGI